jgi:hypothetical protein
MRTGLAYALVVLVIASSIAISNLSYLASQGSRPPQIVLVYQGNTYSGALDNYCWPNAPANGTCTDLVNIGARADIPPPIPVAQNSSLAFQVLGSSRPASFRIIILDERSCAGGRCASSSVETKESDNLAFNLQSGYYRVVAFARWSGGGGVGYTYEIRVAGG